LKINLFNYLNKIKFQQKNMKIYVEESVSFVVVIEECAAVSPRMVAIREVLYIKMKQLLTTNL